MNEFACVDEENREEWEFLLYDYVEKLCDKDVRKELKNISRNVNIVKKNC